MPDVGMVDGMDGRRSGPSAQRTRGSHGSPRGIPPAMSLPYGDPYGVPSRFFELFGTLLFIAGTLSFHYFILSPIQYGCHPTGGFRSTGRPPQFISGQRVTSIFHFRNQLFDYLGLLSPSPYLFDFTPTRR